MELKRSPMAIQIEEMIITEDIIRLESYKHEYRAKCKFAGVVILIITWGAIIISLINGGLR